jgi:hypothetical protein
MAPWALFNGYQWTPDVATFSFDASGSLTALERDSTIIAVIDETMWLELQGLLV